MILEMRSPRTGKMNEMDLPITAAEFHAGQVRRCAGALIQDAFPTLTPEQREFVMSGYTPEDWAAIFPPEEDG